MSKDKKLFPWLNLKAFNPAVAVFVAALSVRLLVVALFPELIPPSTDKLHRYDPIALSLLKGEGFKIDGDAASAAQAAPGYPIFLSAIYFLFGYSNLAAQIFLALADAGNCLIIYLIAKRYFSGLVSTLAGIVLIFLPHSFYLILTMVPEPLFMLLQSLFLLSLSEALQDNRIRDFFVSGITLGMATLCRAVSLLLPLFILLVFIAFGRVELRRGLFMFLLGSILSISPWIVRNYALFHQFIPVQALGGHAIYYATFDYSDSTDRQAVSNNRERLRNTEHTMIEQDRFYYRNALNRIMEEPLKFVKLMGRRLWSMWYATDSGRYQTPLKILHGGLLALAVTGFVMSRRQWRDLLLISTVIVYYIALHTILIGIARYIFPVIPLLIMFAVIPIGELADGFQVSKRSDR